jgi:hypothetical protein
MNFNIRAIWQIWHWRLFLVHQGKCAFDKKFRSHYFFWIIPLRTYKISQYKLPKQLVNATSLKLHSIILWNLVASKDIICRYAYWLEILISWFFQELCSIELLSLLSVQYVGACGMWACSLRFFHCLYNILVIMSDMASSLHDALPICGKTLISYNLYNFVGCSSTNIHIHPG